MTVGLEFRFRVYGSGSMCCAVAGLVLVLVVVAVLVGGKLKQQHQVAILVAARCNRVRKLNKNLQV